MNDRKKLEAFDGLIQLAAARLGPDMMVIGLGRNHQSLKMMDEAARSLTPSELLALTIRGKP